MVWCNYNQFEYVRSLISNILYRVIWCYYNQLEEVSKSLFVKQLVQSKSKQTKTSSLFVRVVTIGFSSQRANNAESVSMSFHHHCGCDVAVRVCSNHICTVCLQMHYIPRYMCMVCALLCFVVARDLSIFTHIPLLWRHNGFDSVSNN